MQQFLACVPQDRVNRTTFTLRKAEAYRNIFLQEVYRAKVGLRQNTKKYDRVCRLQVRLLL